MKVDSHDIVVQIAHLSFPVPACFNHSLDLFEVGADDPQLEQLDMGDGLVEVHCTDRPDGEIPVSNPTKHNVVLASRTVLGSIQPIDKIVQTDQVNNVQVNGVNAQPLHAAELWHPPVNVVHLREEGKAVVKQQLYEETNAFACDTDYIPDLQMTISLKG